MNRNTNIRASSPQGENFIGENEGVENCVSCISYSICPLASLNERCAEFNDSDTMECGLKLKNKLVFQRELCCQWGNPEVGD